MNGNFIPFALPEIGQEEIDEVLDTMKSNWLTTGPKTKIFENNFSKIFGEGFESIAVSSATAGLHLALEAVGIKEGDFVVTTPYTFTATAEVIRYLGAHPIFIDIDTDSFNISPSKLMKVMEEHGQRDKIKAIIPVHFAGLSCKMDDILNIAKAFKLKVIEDAAHALPSTYSGRLVGSFESDATVFSFYATKTITTGEGGMILTRNKNISDRCRTMRLHGINRDVFDRYVSKKPSWFYEVVAPGYKYNMTDIAASIGIQQLKKIWDFQQKRAMIAYIYNAAFKDLPLILPPMPMQGDTHSWHLYVIRLAPNSNIGRNRFIELMADKGIGCSVHFIPLHIHPYWRDTYSLKPEDYPNSLNSYNVAVSLPIYSRMSEDEVQRVIDAVSSIFYI